MKLICNVVRYLVIYVIAIIVGIGTDIVITVADATEQLQQRYVGSRFSSSVDEWPPYQPKHYTTLAFIHNKGNFTDAVRFFVAQELAVAGNINATQLHGHSNLNANMTKNISDIFLPVMASDGSFVDLHILIEGAPGIGKTVLAKEIAYQWAKSELLTSKKLLLLVFLRECHQKTMMSIEDLIQFVFRNSEMTSCVTKYLTKTEGKDTVIIFDGFDELSEENRKRSIIVDIFNRIILSKCCLVVTSRPTASSILHESVDRRVEIVGFTEDDRLEYIQTALENHDEQVEALQHYLQSNPTINALCYIPLNMTILLCLVEDAINRLPKTQTEMYKRFIETTIIRYIKKFENRDIIINIAELPHPYDKLLKELARLAYKALKTDKIVFTLSEINKDCPNLTMTSSNWNGLGLLKAVQCYSKEIGNDQVTFHFLHFSIQEYMAAWYISKLSNSKQIKLLQKTFWEHRYYTTWIMYVGITGGCSFALRHFMSGNRFQLYSKVFGASKVSSKFLKHKMKCLHLFQCLVEVDKVDSMKQLDSVKELFQNNQIDLSNQTLLPSDLNTLGFFLIRSINKEWDELNLSNCSIGSNGSNVLCDRLLDKDVRFIVTIKTVNFSYNQLHFSSLIRLFGLFNSWHTSEIIITDDASLGKTTDQKIEDIVLQSSTLVLVHITSWLFCKNAELSKIHHILSNTTNIESVYFLNCTWTYNSEVLTLLRKQKLNKVRIIGSFNLGLFFENNLIKTLASILLNNNDFVNMFVYDPTMPDEFAEHINNLILSSNKDISGVILIVSSSKVQGMVNTCSLSNELSALEIFNLSRYIRYSNTEMCPWSLENNNRNKDVIFTFIKLLHKTDFDWKLKVLLWENNTLIVHNAKLKSFDKFKQFTNINIYLSDCDFDEVQYDVISGTCSTLHILNSPECVKMLHAKLSHKQSVPNELFIYGDINYKIMNSLIELLSHDHVDISAVLAANGIMVGIHPSSELFALAFQLQPLPTTWILSTTRNISVFYQVIDGISIIPDWLELDFTGCDIGDVDCEVVQRTFMNNNCSTVRKLNISFNKLSVSGIPDLTKIVLIWRVQQLNINGTNDTLLDCLIKNLTCKHQNSFFVSITYNHKILLVVCNKSWDEVVTKMNTHASELYIINCDLLLNTTGFIDYLHTVHNVLRLHITDGSVSATVAIKFFECFSKETVEVSISNISITGDGEVIRNLLTARDFCLDAKFNLLVSTDDHWLCVYNITKYQLHFIHQYFMNQTPSNRYGMTLIRKLEQLSRNKMYMFDNNLVYLLCTDGNIRDSIMNTAVEFTSHDDHKISVVLVANNVVAGIYPNSEQIAAVFHLQQSPTTWIQYNAVSVSVFYQIIYGLSILHTTWAELDFTNCNIGDVECESMHKNLKLNHYSTVRKLNISLNKLSISGILNLVEIILLWRAQELNINKSNNVLHNCLVKKLAKEHHRCSFLSITCNHKVIVCNTSWDKITKILNGQVSELHVINCILDSKELISYLKTTHSLLRFCLIKGHVSVAIVIEILKLDKNIEVTISDVKIIDDDRIRNLITQRKFYLGIKSSLMISTSKWLCVHNITKYQLPLIHQYFMGQAHSDSYGMGLVRKLEQINGDKMYVFDNNLLTAVRVHAGVPQAVGASQIITALSDTVSLHTIEIDNYAITNETVYDLANILHHNTQLQELYLSGNCLHADSTIAKMLHSISTSSVCKNHTTNDVASNFTVTETSITSAANLEASDSTATIEAGSLHSTGTLKKFSISNNRITHKAASDVSAVISNNIHLQEVNLGYNNLQASGIIKIAESLQKISSLTKLYINHNNITHEAADDIAAVISCNTSLQEIDVSGNDLQARGAKKIAKALRKIYALEKLNLSNNNITGRAADDIAAAISCTKLQEIDISKNNLTAGVRKIMKALQGINTLRKLCFDNNNITVEAADDIAAVVSRNTKLQEINISENNLRTIGVRKIMKALQGINTLRKLYLGNNNITDEAADDIAAAISCNTKLQEINISENNLLTIGVQKIMKALQGIDTLRKLCFDNNNITVEAADDIAAVVSHNTKLQEIDISENNLTSGVRKIMRALQGINTLKKLYLGNNSITDEAADDIAAAISCNTKLQEININENNLLTIGVRKIMKALQGIDTLRKLCLGNNNITGEATDDIAAVVSHNTKLQEVDISKNNLTAGVRKIMRALQGINTLRKLCLSNSNITDEAADDIAAAVSRNTKLQEINISENNLLTTGVRKIMKALQGIDTLRKLYLSNNNITGEAADDIAAVVSCNTKLQEIDISENNLTAGVQKIMRALQGIYTLKKLCLGSNNTTGEAAEDIATVVSCNTKLQEIDISTNDLQTKGIIRIAIALRQTYGVTKLCLSNNNITDIAADEIAKAISHNIHLQEFHISGNKLSTVGAIKIAKALQNVFSLKALYISDNKIDSTAAHDIATAIDHANQLHELDISKNNFKARGIEIILKPLQNCDQLTKLYISDNNVTDDTITHDVRTLISCNTGLQEIDISGNNLQARGAINVAAALQSIVMLTKLCISNNNITCQGANDIATAITYNVHLQHLSIGGNYLLTTGATIIAKSLQKISTLIKLYINNNKITSAAADDIAAAVSCNPHLEEFDISENNIERIGAIKLARSFQQISTLKKLFVNHNRITDEAADDIAAAVSRNADLEEFDISENKIEGRGAIKLARSFQEISTLKKIFVNHNRITGVAADDIAYAISLNPHLTEFKINGNLLEFQGLKIIKAANRNRTKIDI